MRARKHFEFISEYSSRWPVSVMCDVLHVSETGYYRFKRNLGNPSKDAVLSAVIQEILDEYIYNDNYGVDRMQIALRNLGYKVGRRRIARIMKENGWLHERKRRPKGLTRATTEIQEKENLIKQDFISPIMDCFNGEILSLVMRSNMCKELCIDTFNAAAKRFPLNGAILHSDCGSQYTSETFREELNNAGVLQSLSGVNRCFDNARMESFFATLKKELLYRIPTYKMKMEEVKVIVFRYVFIYYNRIRIYTSNPDGLPPAAYRRRLEQPLAEAA